MKDYKTAYVVVECSDKTFFIDGVYLQLDEARKRREKLRIAGKTIENHQAVIYYRNLQEGKEDERL